MTGPIRPTLPAPMPPSGDDVGWGYRRPSGDDVGWGRASSCASGGCVKAARDGDTVRVWDGKLGDDSPVQEWPLKEWAELLRAIRVDSGQRAWHYINDFSAVVLTRGSVELTFTSDEWDDFAGGVLSGDFEPGNLTSADPSPALEGSADGAVGRSGHRAAAAAGEGDLSSPSPVAPMNGAPIGDGDPTGPPPRESGIVVSGSARAVARAAVVEMYEREFAEPVLNDSFRDYLHACADAAVDAFLTAIWSKAISPLIQHVPPALNDFEDSPIATSGEAPVPSGAGAGCGGEVAPVGRLGDQSTGATEPRLVGATRDEILP